MKAKRAAAFIALITSTLLISPTSQSAQDPKSSDAGLSKDLIYFVMPDRYLNGDPTNDLAGGVGTDPTQGFNPTSTAFFHGGDLKGLTGTCEDGDNGLARIKNLGFTALWLTPLVTQQQATNSGAGYHGYWGTDFLNVDPHLGTNEDLTALAECAKKLGMKLILDVVTNHTGDVIQYLDRTAYIPEDKVNTKNPAWLNDLSNYHNVGDMSRCWGDGSCTQQGDFYGLDDIATEKEVVYKGLTDIYGEWIEKYGFVGFRVDTARHVDNNFFKNWSPGINASARAVGINDFTIFGEVWDINPMNLASFVRERGLQTVLDFAFQRTSLQYVSGLSGAEVMANLFESDDLYTSQTTNAKNLVTFLGNHDMGRVGFLIPTVQVKASKDLLARTELAHALMYLSRGIPVVYYGDEVGMTGSGNGGDQQARQDMFATNVEIWKTEKRIGGQPIGEGDSFNSATENPISIYLRSLAELRAKYPVLANGNMQIRYAKDGLLVFSKFDEAENTEYIVAMNSSSTSMSKSVKTSSNSQWKSIFGSNKFSSKQEVLSVTLPAFSTSVFQSKAKITPVKSKVAGLTVREDFLTGYIEAVAKLDKNSLKSVTFSTKVSGTNDWVDVGTDFNWPYRIYLNPADYKAGATITVKATVNNGKAAGSQSRTAKFTRAQ